MLAASRGNGFLAGVSRLQLLLQVKARRCYATFAVGHSIDMQLQQSACVARGASVRSPFQTKTPQYTVVALSGHADDAALPGNISRRGRNSLYRGLTKW